MRAKLATWAATLKITLEIVCKRDARAFEIPPRRWVIEAPWPGSSAAAGAPTTTNDHPKATKPWSYGP
jgi:hypothetical protein